MTKHADAHMHDRHAGHAGHAAPAGAASGLNRLALTATLHCLSGCAVGEVLGMVLGTALALANAPTVVLSTVLAFAFGYAFTVVPLRRGGLPWKRVAALALASDTASITIMEIVDNGLMLVIPGAMEAGLARPLFWGALAGSLIVGAVAAYPVNRWLIARGRGHAVVHAHHEH